MELPNNHKLSKDFCLLLLAEYCGYEHSFCGAANVILAKIGGRAHVMTYFETLSMDFILKNRVDWLELHGHINNNYWE